MANQEIVLCSSFSMAAVLQIYHSKYLIYIYLERTTVLMLSKMKHFSCYYYNSQIDNHSAVVIFTACKHSINCINFSCYLLIVVNYSLVIQNELLTWFSVIFVNNKCSQVQLLKWSAWLNIIVYSTIIISFYYTQPCFSRFITHWLVDCFWRNPFFQATTNSVPNGLCLPYHNCVHTQWNI